MKLAAILWSPGICFGGVLALLYADLFVLPLLDVYLHNYGWEMAAYVAAIFFTTMVATGLHLVTAADPHIRARIVH